MHGTHRACSFVCATAADQGARWIKPRGHNLSNNTRRMDYQRYVVRRIMNLIQRDFETTTWQSFWKTFVQGRPATEVAAELHLSLAAVYKAASRMRHRLRQEL